MSFIASVTRCPVPLPHNTAYTSSVFFNYYAKLFRGLHTFTVGTGTTLHLYTNIYLQFPNLLSTRAA
jgi:hypothetical protein